MPSLQKRIDALEDPLCAELAATLRGTDSLELLRLSGNSYGLPFFRALAELLRPMRHITEVDLSDVFVTRKGEILPSLEALAGALVDKQIRRLDFSANALCPEGVAALESVITRNPIACLLLDHVALARAGTVTLSRAITAGGLKLRVLQLSKNRMEDRAADLARALAGQTQLQELVLFQNAVRGQTMTELLEAVSGCTALRRLDISDNVIYDEHRQALLGVLGACAQLEELNLSDCNVGPELGDAFFAELARVRPPRLHTLRFDYNEVGLLLPAMQAVAACPAMRCFSFKSDDHSPEELERARAARGGVVCTWQSEDEEEEEGEAEAGKSGQSTQTEVDQLARELADLHV